MVEYVKRTFACLDYLKSLFSRVNPYFHFQTLQNAVRPRSAGVGFQVQSGEEVSLIYDLVGSKVGKALLFLFHQQGDLVFGGEHEVTDRSGLSRGVVVGEVFQLCALGH